MSPTKRAWATYVDDRLHVPLMAASVDRDGGAGPALVIAGLSGVLVAATYHVVGWIAARSSTLLFSMALLLIGWAWATGGSMSRLRRRTLAQRRLIAWAAVGGAAWSLSAFVEFQQGPSPASPAIGAVLIVSALATHRSWWPGSRAVVSMAVVFGLLFATAAAYMKREWYPLSPFQMYSVAQLDPRSMEVPVVIARMGAREVDITGTLGRATVRELVSDDDSDRVLAALEVIAATRERRSGRAVEAIEIRDQVWTVAPYPGPPTIELTHEVTRLSYDRSD